MRQHRMLQVRADRCLSRVITMPSTVTSQIGPTFQSSHVPGPFAYGQPPQPHIQSSGYWPFGRRPGGRQPPARRCRRRCSSGSRAARRLRSACTDSVSVASGDDDFGRLSAACGGGVSESAWRRIGGCGRRVVGRIGVGRDRLEIRRRQHERDRLLGGGDRCQANEPRGRARRPVEQSDCEECPHAEDTLGLGPPCGRASRESPAARRGFGRNGGIGRAGLAAQTGRNDRMERIGGRGAAATERAAPVAQLTQQAKFARGRWQQCRLPSECWQSSPPSTTHAISSSAQASIDLLVGADADPQAVAPAGVVHVADQDAARP